MFMYWWTATKCPGYRTSSCTRWRQSSLSASSLRTDPVRRAPSLPTHSASHPSTRAATKVGAIVSGQTSVKAPEKAAFEKYLPEDVHIVSCHSLHGPTVSPLGQPLVGAPARFARGKPKVSWLSSRSSSSIEHLNGRSGWWRTYCARYDRATSICPTRTMTSSLRTHKQ